VQVLYQNKIDDIQINLNKNKNKFGDLFSAYSALSGLSGGSRR
jgi:hypothetical protein